MRFAYIYLNIYHFGELFLFLPVVCDLHREGAKICCNTEQLRCDGFSVEECIQVQYIAEARNPDPLSRFMRDKKI